MLSSISRGIDNNGVSASNNDACPGSAVPQHEVCHSLLAVYSPVTRALPSSQPPPEINVLPISTYAQFLSQVAKARKPSPSPSAHHISLPSNALNFVHVPMHTVRELYPLEQTPGVISLLAGKPNAALFPFTGVQITIPCPDGPEQMLLTVDNDLLSMGLQYAPTNGIPPMVEWLTEFQEQEHGRKSREGWRISVTAGSQDGIYKVRPVRACHFIITYWYLIGVPGYSSAGGSWRSCLDREAGLCVRRNTLGRQFEI